MMITYAFCYGITWFVAQCFIYVMKLMEDV